MTMSWDRVRVRLGAGGRVRCERGWRLEPEWSDRLRDFDLWLVWAGRGAMTLRDRTITLRPGVCLWMRPGGRYLAEHDPDDRLGVTYLHFDLVGPGGKRVRDARLPPEVFDVLDIGYVDTVLSRIATRRGSESDAALMRVLTGLLMELTAGSLSPSARAPGMEGVGNGPQREQMLRAAARLREDAANTPTVAQLARKAGYTPDHFTRLFRATIGRTPQDYAVASRIDRARQLLVESGLSVTRVAEALGYRDVFFFSRQFKARVGLSPAAFRRSALKTTGGASPDRFA